MRRISMVLVLGLLGLFSGKSALAQKSLTFERAFSGVTQQAPYDLDGDGVPGLRVTHQFKARPIFKLGPTSWEASLDGAVPAETPSGACAPDELEFTAGTGQGVHRYWNGGLVIWATVEGYTCVDPTTGRFYGTFQWQGIGGTGYFAGATGNMQDDFEGQTLQLNSEGAPAFSIITGVHVGTLNLP